MQYIVMAILIQCFPRVGPVPKNGIIIAYHRGIENASGQLKSGNKKGMGKKSFLLCACFLAASFASVASGDEAFDPVRVVYMTNGEAIYCQMASLEGVRMVCRKANGSVSVPLRDVDFEKTFPKYERQEGETVLLVHAGQLYRDENIIVSNLRMIREEQNGTEQSALYTILCDVLNRSDPSEIRVSIIAKDGKGSSRFAIDLDSEARLGKDQRAVLKKPLDALARKIENQITTLRVGDVERRNILKKEEAGDGHNGVMSPERLREQKIRNLKEGFLN
jgi:hypothetical protein